MTIALGTAAAHGYDVEHLQTNREGELIDAIHGARAPCAAIVINAAAFTHSSFAIADALAAFDGVKVELHISNPQRASTGGTRRWSRRTSPGTSPASAPRGTASRSKPRSPSWKATMTTVLDRLPAMDIGPPAAKLRPLIADAGIDALLVTLLANVRYLTGFTGSAGWRCVTPTKMVFTTDGRYRTQRRSSSTPRASTPVSRSAPRSASSAPRRPAGRRARVGLEAATVTWAQQRELVAQLDGHELVPTEGVVERLRR